MALINGNDYDHIDFTKNGVTTRHMLKDTLSRQMSGDLVKVQNEEPTSEGTKIWIKPSGDSEVQVPTYEEFEELSEKIDDADATIESLAVGDHPTVSVTEVDGHKRFSFGIPASNGIASITKTATDGVIDTYTIAMTDGTSTSFSVNNSDITPESMVEAITTALQDYARIDGYYPDMTVGNAEQLNSSKYVENSEPYTLRTSGGSSDIGNREYLDAVVGGTVAWNQMVRDEASENSTDFAPIVTVTDAVEDAAGVKVKIEPVQDLHGYDHPWPGGGSANKWDEQWEKGTYNTANGTKTNVDNQLRCKNLIPVIPGQTYYAKNVDWAGFMDADGNIVETPDVGITNVTRSNNAVHIKNLVFTVPQTAQWMWFYELTTYGDTYKNDISINNPSTVTDYAPYSNICPITGLTEAKVTRTGVNVWDEEWELGGISLLTGENTTSTNRIRSKNFIPVRPGETYCFDLPWVAVCAYDVNKHFIASGQSDNRKPLSFPGCSDDTATHPRTWVIPTGVYYVRFHITTTYGTEYKHDSSINYPATNTTYHPFTGATTIPITLPTEAGTVYGGTLDVSTGELVVDRAVVDLASLVWTPYGTVGTNRRIASNKLPNVVAPSASNVIGDFITEKYKTTIYSTLNYLDFSQIAMSTAGDLLKGFDDVNYPTGNICYKLATPITYTITPSEIRTLLGTNNVWADTGDLALTYTGTDEHLTLESGRKYLARLSGTDSMLLGSGQEITAAKGTDNVFDLTKMFGTAVADYVYGQGAAFFRKWFGKQWYPYNAGELKHVEGLSAHEMVGFNLWDEEWEVGGYGVNGKLANANGIRNKNLVRVIPGQTYYFKRPSNISVYATGYSDENYSNGQSITIYTYPLTFPDGVNYIGWNVNMSAYGSTTYKNDICINLAHNNSRNGEYEPYEKHSYPLDSSVVLRGIPKVDANGVYWDGDRYLPDGTVERRYGVVDLGTLIWTKLNVGTDAERFVTSGISSLYKNPTTSQSTIQGNLVCSNYYEEPWTALNTQNSGKFMCVNAYNNSNIFAIRDISYTGLTANEFKSAMSGVLLIYELAEPTTETAQPYHSTQWVSDWGTEEFVSTGIVPVGHETRYPANLRDKLQHLPDAASGNGSYLITQTDGQMVLTPFPAPPSSAGNYVLKATVVNGVATYTWEVAT